MVTVASLEVSEHDFNRFEVEGLSPGMTLS